MLEQAGTLDYLFAGLGGGGLLAGSVLAAQHLCRACRVIGVEPEHGNDGQQSLRLGGVVEIPVPDTIADGARTIRLGRHTFAVIRAYVDDIVTVSDRHLVDALRFSPSV